MVNMYLTDCTEGIRRLASAQYWGASYGIQSLLNVFLSRRTIYPRSSVEDPVFEGHWDGVDAFFSMCIQAAH